jgi:hypothetical protein
MRKFAIATLAISTLISTATVTVAQTATQPLQFTKQSEETNPYNVIDLSRAKNLARQAAERANGGVSNYTAEPAMHGPASESPYRVNADGTVTFTFVGGEPGYAVPSIESVVTVDPNGWAVTVDYNGSIRAEAGI